MDLEDMINLVMISDGLLEAEKAVAQLTQMEGCHVGYSYNEGALGKMTHVVEIIRKYSPLYDEEKIERMEGMPEYLMILENTEYSAEDRARRLLQID